MHEKKLKKLKETKEENKMLKDKNGITLIALVVTIVVLLILAGVSISLILDNNGIIAKSKDARKEYKQAQTNEQADLDNASKWIDDVISNKVEPENIADWGYTEEEDGTITINSYKGNDTTVIIPNYINGKPVKRLCYGMGSIWTEICSDRYTYFGIQQTIKEVIISEGIETIGNYAFAYSYGLEHLTVPNSATTIEEYAFRGCTSLTNITIPNSVTSIGYGAFEDCIITVNVPFKEGETPEGWDANWNDAAGLGNGNVTVNYLK